MSFQPTNANLRSSVQDYILNGNPNNLPDISLWDTSQVTSMWAIFASMDISSINLSNWNTSNVTTMDQMFRGAVFNQDISSWDVSSVTNMVFMFTESTFNQDISSWDVSNVTNMANLFKDTPFNQDISSWNVSNVTSFANMFENTALSNQNKYNIYTSWGAIAPFPPSLVFYESDLSSWSTNPNPGAAGDPYLYPMRGAAYKLRDMDGIYRGLDNGHGVYCNFQVGRSTTSHEAAIRTYASGTQEPANEQVIDSGFFIQSVVFGTQESSVQWSMSSFAPGERDCLEYHGDVSGFSFQLEDSKSVYLGKECKGTCRTLVITHNESGISSAISRYDNPQVASGVSIRGADPLQCKGLFIENQKSKMCMLPSLHTMYHAKVEKRMAAPIRTHKRVTLGGKERVHPKGRV